MKRTNYDRRKLWKRSAAAALAAGCFLLLGTGTALADEREKIEDITLHIETGIEVGNSSWEVDVETEDDTYSVDGYEILNPAGEWAGGMTPKIEVVLTAEDGYYFAKPAKDMFTLSGEGAKYVSASRKDNNTVMNLVIHLDTLEQQELTVTGLRWNRSDKQAEWDRTPGAKYYQVRLYRGGSLAVSVSTRSGETSYDFSSYMTGEGRYYFEVRAVGSGSAMGEWKSSDSWNPSSSDRGDPESGKASDKDYDDFEDDRVFNTSNSAYSEDDEGGEGPRDGDDDSDSSGGPGVNGSSGNKSNGTGPGAGGSGNKNGASSSSGSSKGSDGMTSGTPGTSGTPAASGERNSGTGASQDSYNSGKSADGGIKTDEQNYWHKDEGGWWLHLENGKYPYNTWELVDGQWYCFGEAGYLRHGWVQDGGNWYFCDLQNGAMLVNAKTPDGHYVGGDGVWIR